MRTKCCRSILNFILHNYGQFYESNSCNYRYVWMYFPVLCRIEYRSRSSLIVSSANQHLFQIYGRSNARVFRYAGAKTRRRVQDTRGIETHFIIRAWTRSRVKTRAPVWFVRTCEWRPRGPVCLVSAIRCRFVFDRDPGPRSKRPAVVRPSSLDPVRSRLISSSRVRWPTIIEGPTHTHTRSV